ncbi:YitT family protein, partial [Paenibacillus sp. OT2-17]|nr:YitT family protein [Paenibacillus sp. OT2-17]
LTVCLGGLILNYFMPLTEKVLDRILTHSHTSLNHEKDKKHSI